MKNKKLTAWQKATNAVAQEFCTKYFETDDWYWIGGEIGGIIDVANYCFGLGRIVDALEINCSYELLMRFYDYETECYYDKKLPKYNFKVWVKYFAGFGSGNIQED